MLTVPYPFPSYTYHRDLQHSRFLLSVIIVFLIFEYLLYFDDKKIIDFIWIKWFTKFYLDAI